MKAVLYESGCHLDREPVPPPIVGRQLQTKDGCSCWLARLTETCATAKSRTCPLENADLNILTRILLPPHMKNIKQLVRPPGVGINPIVEPSVSRVHLVADERLAIGLREIAQQEAGCFNAHSHS